MDHKELETVFSEEFLQKIPVMYRFMVKMTTAGVGELYNGARFSICRAHGSKEYINYPSYKPVSNVLLKEIEEQETANTNDHAKVF